MKCFKLYFSFTRIPPTFLFVFIFLLSFFLGGGEKYTSALLGILLIFFMWHFGTTYNDITDVEIDRISNPERPLVNSINNIRVAKVFVVLDVFFVLLICILYPFLFFPCIFMIILLFFYSYPKIRIKKRKFATITQGFMGLVCSYIGIAFSSFNLQNFLLAIYSLISLCVFSVVKDFKDIEGDKKYSIYTLPVVLGKKKAVRFIQTMILIFIISSYIWKYFISQLTASFVILFFCVGLCGIICLELLNKGKIGGKALYKCGILLLALALLLLTLK